MRPERRHRQLVGIIAYIQDLVVIAPSTTAMDGKNAYNVGAHVTERHGSGRHARSAHE